MNQPANPFLSPRHVAIMQKTAHQFVAGLGYIRHPEPPAAGPDTMLDPMQTPCSPPDDTLDGSPHWLQAPKGGKTMMFAWVAAEKAWERPGGLRMAYTTGYLAHHGWTYDGPISFEAEAAA